MNIILENADRILRPVCEADAEFIVQLRNMPHVRGRVNDSATDVNAQRKWIREYLMRPDEYYWVIVRKEDQVPVGTTSLYHYDAMARQIEIGRWVMVKDHGINLIASRIQQLDFAFDQLHVNRVVCDVASYNKPVLRYHRSVLKEREVGVQKALFVIGGKPVDMIWFEVAKEEWPQMRARLLKFVQK